jgi:MFS family permease
MLLSHGSQVSSRPASAVAGLTTAGYLGFMAGPPVVGWLAGAASMKAGLLGLACVGIVAAALARRAPQQAARPEGDQAAPVGLRQSAR